MSLVACRLSVVTTPWGRYRQWLPVRVIRVVIVNVSHWFSNSVRLSALSARGVSCSGVCGVEVNTFAGLVRSGRGHRRVGIRPDSCAPDSGCRNPCEARVSAWVARCACNHRRSAASSQVCGRWARIMPLRRLRSDRAGRLDPGR